MKTHIAHSTHYDDCGCLSERFLAQLAAKDKVINEIRRVESKSYDTYAIVAAEKDAKISALEKEIERVQILMQEEINKKDEELFFKKQEISALEDRIKGLTNGVERIREYLKPRLKNYGFEFFHIDEIAKEALSLPDTGAKDEQK